MQGSATPGEAVPQVGKYPDVLQIGFEPERSVSRKTRPRCIEDDVLTCAS